MKEKIQKYLFWSALLLIFSVFSFFLTKEIKLWRSPIGSCGFFSQKYCRQAKIVDFQGEKVIAVNIPVGTMIYSPFDGDYRGDGKIALNTEIHSTISVNETIDYKNTGREALLIVDCAPDPNLLNPIGLAIRSVKKGEKICAVSGTQKITDDYNVSIVLGRFDETNREFLPDEKILKEFFPYAKK